MRPRPSTACATGCARWRCPARAGHPAGRRHLQRHHRRHQQPASARADHLHARHRGRRVAGLAAGDVRGAPTSGGSHSRPAHRRRRRHPGYRRQRRHRAVEIGEALRVCWNASGPSRGRTKAALASARDFAAVSAHELHAADRHAHESGGAVPLDLPPEQTNGCSGDVIRTQSRIEATLGALERLAQGNCPPKPIRVPVDITELLDRAAHDAMRVYPISGDPSIPDVHHHRTAGRTATGGGQRDRQRGQTRRHPGPTLGGELTRRSGDRGRRQWLRCARSRATTVFERFAPGIDASPFGLGLGLRWWPSRPRSTVAPATGDSPLGGARLVPVAFRHRTGTGYFGFCPTCRSPPHVRWPHRRTTPRRWSARGRTVRAVEEHRVFVALLISQPAGPSPAGAGLREPSP